jgi:AcrR family transcriptional regulator
MSTSLPPRSSRDQLIAITLELLDDHHPEDLSLREVARRAGLTSGAPAHHFGNKLGLLAACAETAWTELCVRLEAEDTSSGSEDGLRNQARAYIAYALDNPGPYRLIASRLFDDAEHFPQISEWRNRTMRTMVDLIPQPADDPKHPWRRCLAVWALLHGYVTLVLDGAITEPKMAAFTDDICRMAPVIGLLPPGGTVDEGR